MLSFQPLFRDLENTIDIIESQDLKIQFRPNPSNLLLRISIIFEGITDRKMPFQYFYTYAGEFRLVPVVTSIHQNQGIR